MLKYSFLLVLSIFLFACQSEQTTGNAKSAADEKKEKSIQTVKLDDPSELIKNPLTASKDKKDHSEGIVPTIEFTDVVFDFGTIGDNDSISHDFVFTNKGKGPLIIHEARTTCGCTVASYPKDPIPVGATDTVSIEFNSKNKMGKQAKEIRIFTNAIPKETVLKMIGVVDPRN